MRSLYAEASTGRREWRVRAGCRSPPISRCRGASADDGGPVAAGVGGDQVDGDGLASGEAGDGKGGLLGAGREGDSEAAAAALRACVDARVGGRAEAQGLQAVARAGGGYGHLELTRAA